MALRLTAPDGLIELRRLVVDGIVLGEEMVLDAELVADAAHSEARFAATVANWVEVSDDGGATYTALGTSVQSGLDLGPQVAGARTALKIKVVPQAAFRQRRVGLLIGEGT